MRSNRDTVPNFYIEDKEGVDSPIFLERSLGSLASERRESKRKSYAKYNKVVKEFRKQVQSFNLLYISTPDGYKEFNIQLSHWMALYPSTSFTISFNLQELTKSNAKLLRSFLMYYELNKHKMNKWVVYEIEQNLDRLLGTEKILSGQVVTECYIIRQTFDVAGRDLGRLLIEQTYSSSNIQKWYKTGKSLMQSFKVVKIPLAIVIEKVRRRGYKETKCNNPNSTLTERREIAMSEEARELEETKQRILLKQAKLFEQRLDRYLELGVEDIPASKRREIFSSLIFDSYKKEETENENLQKNLTSKGEEENERES